MNKKYGAFILKPDIFENEGLNELSILLTKYGLPIKGSFLIRDYSNFSLEYRKYDLNIRYKNDPLEYERNYKRNLTAIHAYKMEYKGEKDKGIALIIENGYRNEEEFYNIMNQIKVELREKIEKKLGYVTYLYMGEDPWFTFRDKRERLPELRTKENKSIDIAFINLIHLEDRDLFGRDACICFLIRKNIFNADNIIVLDELKSNYNNVNNRINMEENYV